MATIKSYTDLSQSKKLAEILPLESADMSYYIFKDDGHLVSPVPFVLDGTEVKEGGVFEYIPCWSLAALFSVLPYPFLSELSNEMWKCGCYPNGICYYVASDSPINACYEMIIKLHELNLL